MLDLRRILKLNWNLVFSIFFPFKTFFKCNLKTCWFWGKFCEQKCQQQIDNLPCHLEIAQNEIYSGSSLFKWFCLQLLSRLENFFNSSGLNFLHLVSKIFCRPIWKTCLLAKVCDQKCQRQIVNLPCNLEIARNEIYSGSSLFKRFFLQPLSKLENILNSSGLDTLHSVSKVFFYIKLERHVYWPRFLTKNDSNK